MDISAQAYITSSYEFSLPFFDLFSMLSNPLFSFLRMYTILIGAEEKICSYGLIFLLFVWRLF